MGPRKPLDRDAVLLEIREELRRLAPERRGTAPLFRDWCVDFLADYARRGNRPSTLASKGDVARLYLLPPLGRYRLDEIGQEQVGEVFDHMGALAPGTVNGALGLLKMMLWEAHSRGLIATVPRIRLVKQRTKRTPVHDFEAYARLVAAGKALGWRQWLAVLLTGDIGLRAGEAIGLRWANIDMEAGRIHIVEQDGPERSAIPPKSEPRTVGMTDDLREALAAAESPRDGRVLIGARGRPVGRGMVRHWILQAATHANVMHDGGAHRLRHVCASHMGMLGVTVGAIRDILGHADLTVTGKYVNLTEQALADALALLQQGRKRKT